MTLGSPRDLARLARRTFLDTVLRGTASLVSACAEGARLLASQTAEPGLYARRRDLVMAWPASSERWQQGLSQAFQGALDVAQRGGTPSTRPMALQAATGEPGAAPVFSLVDDAVVELDLVASRLTQAVADKAGWQFTDLCSRLRGLLPEDPSPGEAAGDVLKPAMLSRWVLDSWMASGLTADHWKTLQNVLHDEVAALAEEAYHEANRLLLEHGVAPEIDLRPFIRRARDVGIVQPMAPSPGVASRLPGGKAPGGLAAGSNRVTAMGSDGAVSYDETRLMTQAPGLGRVPQATRSQAVLGKLNQVVARQVPGFDPTQLMAQASEPVVMATGLSQAMARTEAAVRQHVDVPVGERPEPAALARELIERKRELKQAARSPTERATIEVVALLFQAILMEERLPATVRVWFARLQMPVLRVAVAEPDFFATLDHPARLLIDRMGACVMGLAGAVEQPETQGDLLLKEVRRVVQTVEAYPDTGRRVFQTVLVEFEKFLENYFKEGNEASRKGVSLAQQLEQREAYAIQYTIELRKMLDAVPVQEGIREFLFKVWADVLAQSAVLSSPGSEDTRELKQMAADLIWSASAKNSREERNQVLQRLPPLLKLLRQGMAKAGLSAERQEQHLKALNVALQAAFTAKSATISPERLREITQRLNALDQLLPEMDDVELDTDTLRDLSGYDSEDLEVVATGGTMPTPAMLAWARELKLGAWFQLDYRDRQERVQLAWQGRNKLLALFVSPQGRGVLFQLNRLGAFLQAGLLVPLEEESLTVRATRDALAKLDADPQRLLS
jgi:Protein of unknown function (DUF1631)